jgi:hypothetical protein
MMNCLLKLKVKKYPALPKEQDIFLVCFDLVMPNWLFSQQMLDEIIPALFGEIITIRSPKAMIPARPDK